MPKQRFETNRPVCPGVASCMVPHSFGENGEFQLTKHNVLQHIKLHNKHGSNAQKRNVIAYSYKMPES